MKQYLDMSAIKKVCNNAAKYEEEKKVYENASWFYLLAGCYECVAKHFEQHINKKSKVIYANLGHSYVLLSEFDKAQKMYEKYLSVEYSPDRYMQEDYKLLFKLYPEYKKHLKKGLAIWNELYAPITESVRLILYYKFSIHDKDHENYKKTDQEKIEYLLQLIDNRLHFPKNHPVLSK